MLRRISSLEPQAFDALLAALPPSGAAYAEALARFAELIRAAYARASGPGTPAEKVRSLEAAKLGLARLRRYAGTTVSGQEDYDVAVSGWDAANEAVERLERTYRALGLYRLAGVD